MRLRTKILLAAAVALSLGLAPQAQASATDVAATHAYIQANYALARASEARAAGAQLDVERFSKKISKQCPNAGAGSPENDISQQVSYEVAGALWSIVFRDDAGPIRAFQHAVRGLHWSNGKLTRMARDYARSLHELSTLATPDVCGDVRAWTASSFTVVPASTRSFSRRVEGIEGKTIPSRLLAPYEQAGDKAILARTTRLERELEENEFEIGFDDWTGLLTTLGLQQ